MHEACMQSRTSSTTKQNTYYLQFPPVRPLSTNSMQLMVKEYTRKEFAQLIKPILLNQYYHIAQTTRKAAEMASPLPEEKQRVVNNISDSSFCTFYTLAD